MPAYKPVFPEIVDPAGVNTSNAVRPIGTTDASLRDATVATTGGLPLTDFAGRSNPYVDYQSIDLLLTLQHPRSTGYDEMCFFIMGQVKELLFRSLQFELFNAQTQLDADEVGNALEILGRASKVAAYIVQAWEVLSTITPEGFNQFRDHLSTASGQLSFMYRHVEFILGNKNRRLAEAFRNMPHVWPGIERALTSRSIYDSAIALLARNGFSLDASALDRDWSEAYVPNKSVEAAWLEIYKTPTPDNRLYHLGEALILIDDLVAQYRWRHFVSVQRIIGLKPGTGGSSGVAWLQHVTQHRFFPELWQIRTLF